jgi:hypothetical protein
MFSDLIEVLTLQLLRLNGNLTPRRTSGVHLRLHPSVRGVLTDVQLLDVNLCCVQASDRVASGGR